MLTNINEIVNVWLSGGTQNKKRRYLCVWNQWNDWLKSKAITEPKPLNCQEFVNFYSIGRSSATTHNAINALRSIYSYLVAIEALERNIWLGGRFYFSGRQRAQVRPTATITQSEVKAILSSLGAGKTPEEVRDRALFFLLFGAGLRRSEAINANVGDVFTCDDSLVLRLTKTKAGVEALQPIPAWAAVKVLDLISQRMLEGADEKSPLFVTWYSGGLSRISQATCYRIFKRACSSCGINAAPHAARAAYATRMLEQGIPKEEVARAMRHGDDQTVHIYDKRLKRVSNNRGKDVIF